MLNKCLPILLLFLLTSCGGSSESNIPSSFPNPYIDEYLYSSSNPGNVTYPSNCDGLVRPWSTDVTGEVNGSATFPARLTSTDSTSFTILRLEDVSSDVSWRLSEVCFPGVPSSPLSFTLNYLANNSSYARRYLLLLDINYKQPNGFYAHYTGFYYFTDIPARLDVAF